MPSPMGNTGGIVRNTLNPHLKGGSMKRISIDMAIVFWGSFFPSLQGMKQIKSPEPDMFRPYVPDVAAFIESGNKPGETFVCTSKIKHTGSSYVDDFNYLKSLVPAKQVKNIKLTLAAPNWYHLRYKEGYAYPKEVYGSDEEYFADIARAYQAELQILYDAGLRNVQIDDPNLACEYWKPFVSAPFSVE